ncbi:hypothetical protein N665_1373s0001 [Sinapis alba]|nr:hypothetical protein N665_1373s0001 [Sinapis alba]
MRPLVHTLQYGAGKDTLTIREVITVAYSREVELKQKGMLSKERQSDGLYVYARGRSSNKNEIENSKPWQNEQKGRIKSKSRSKLTGKSNKTCCVCGTEGHWKRDFPERKKSLFHNKSSNSENIAENLPGPTAPTASLFVSKEEWVLDSGCTFHTTPRKELLTELVEF